MQGHLMRTSWVFLIWWFDLFPFLINGFHRINFSALIVSQAFRIVNKEWEYSHKKGFKCTFERGILHVYFNFKRYRYRRWHAASFATFSSGSCESPMGRLVKISQMYYKFEFIQNQFCVVSFHVSFTETFPSVYV